ncbi:hypothetical protein ACFE04_011002 [Oxalis oulophora]
MKCERARAIFLRMANAMPTPMQTTPMFSVNFLMCMIFTNPLCITDDSYSGKVVPVIAQDISNGSEDGHEPLNLKVTDPGYLLGTSATDVNFGVNSQSARKYSKYAKVDESNTLCLNDLDSVTHCINRTNGEHILELKSFSALLNNAKNHLHLPQNLPTIENHNSFLCAKWVTESKVQNALHIPEDIDYDRIVPLPQYSHLDQVVAFIVGRQVETQHHLRSSGRIQTI